jgi:Protein of unknown function (DUF3106)
MKILTLKMLNRNLSGLGKRRPTTMRTGNNSSGPAGRRMGAVVRAGLSLALTAGLLLVPATGWASHFGGRGGHFSAGRGVRAAGFQEHGQGEQHNGGNAMRSESHPGQERGERQGMRPGQEHLPAWWQAHRGLSPQQQADAMRREPGFRSLPPGQQQRLLDRLHEFDRRPPQVQQRMLDRMEMFERLSPERQQEVRGASQALNHMSPERQQVMRRAFHQLRQMPPEERDQMLHSAYGAQFTPQERTVLGNMLAIEPYQPHVIQPYFGR